MKGYAKGALMFHLYGYTFRSCLVHLSNLTLSNDFTDEAQSRLYIAVGGFQDSL